MERGQKVWWIRLSLMTGAGFLLRLAFVLTSTRYDLPLGDQLYYSAQALTNAQGRWFQQPFARGFPAADHPPLTSLILTPATWLTESAGSFITAQRLTMVVIGTASILLMGLIGRRIAGPTAGLVVAGVTAAYANVWVNDALIMAETPTFFLVATVTYVALGYRSSPTLRKSIALGCLAGVAALTRPELLVLAVLLCALAIALWRQQRMQNIEVAKHLGSIMIAVLLVVAPWILWNQSRFTDSVYLSTNDGLTFAGANCDRTYYDDIGSWDIWCAYGTQVPEGADASQASSLMRRDGLQYLKDHFGRYPVVAIARIVRVLSIGYIGSNNDAAAAEGRPPWVSMLGVIQFWLLGLGAMFGYRRVQQRVDRLILIVMFPVILLVAMVANAYVRFRLPAEVGLIVLASLGFIHLVGLRRRREVSSASE